MSDVDRLLGWFESGDLVRPDASAPNLVDLSRAVAHLCGAPGMELTAGGRRIADAIGPADHYVFVLVDGLGMHLADRLHESDAMRSHLVMELRTVFPTSTAPALTSLATGRWPAEHAVPGWWTYLPDADLTATILPFIERFSEKPLAERGVASAMAFPAVAIAAQYRRNTFWVSPAPISGSVSSRYLSSDAETHGYKSLSIAIEVIARRITNAQGPTYTYLYIPFVDTAEHEHGPFSRPVAKALDHVRARMKTLFEKMSGKARIIVTADHGQIDVPRDARTILDRHDPLVAMLRLPPSCEPRCSAFHVRDGKQSEFAAQFRDRAGDRIALLTIDEADELRLFGDVALSIEMRHRLGDFIAIPRGPDVILYEPKKQLRAMKGFHGGLTPDEVRVPLILA